MRCRAHLLNEQEDTTGGTTTSDSLPTSMVVLSALAPRTGCLMGQCPCPRSSGILGVLLPSRKAQCRPILQDAKGGGVPLVIQLV